MDSQNDQWVIGTAKIRAFISGYKWRTIMHLVNHYSFPLRYLPNGDPAIIVSEVNEWLRVFSEKSSPFRVRTLSGAALISSQGGLIGTLKQNDARFNKKLSKYMPQGEADFFGSVPHGSISMVGGGAQ